MIGARSRRVGFGLLLGALAFALYLPSVRYGFIGVDDPVYVTGNRHVLQGITLEGLRWSLTATEGGSWHPLTWWSHMLAVHLFGTWGGGHHLLNAFLHACSAAVLWGFRLTGAAAEVGRLSSRSTLPSRSRGSRSARTCWWRLAAHPVPGCTRGGPVPTFLAAFALFVLSLWPSRWPPSCRWCSSCSTSGRSTGCVRGRSGISAVSFRRRSRSLSPPPRWPS
jgi:hypothetical protein